jgi:type IV pilus biogenesis protein CpaD/CtpE
MYFQRTDRKNKLNKIIGMALLLMVLSAGACEWREPTMVRQKQIELHKKEYAVKFSPGEFGEEKVNEVSRHFYRFGLEPLRVTVTYNPESKENSAMKASYEAARIAGKLGKAGIKNISTDVLPVAGKDSQAMLTYKAVTAHAPADCAPMPGIDDNISDVEKIGDYKFGCGVDMSLARQILRPKDLMGRKPEDYGDGRRAANMLEKYRAGETREPLEGEQASGD